MSLSKILSAYSGVIPKKSERYQNIHFINGVAVSVTPEVRAEVSGGVSSLVRASVNHARLSKAVQALEDPQLEFSSSELVVSKRGQQFKLPLHSAYLPRWPETVSLPLCNLTLAEVDLLARVLHAAEDVEADSEPVVKIEAADGQMRWVAGDGLGCAMTWVETPVQFKGAMVLSAATLSGVIKFVTELEVEAMTISSVGSGLQWSWSGGRILAQEVASKSFNSEGLVALAENSESWGVRRDDLLSFCSSASFLADRDSDTVTLEPRGSQLRAHYESSFGEYEARLSADAVGEARRMSLSRLKRAVKSAGENGFSLKSAPTAMLCSSDRFISAVAVSA